MMKRFLLMMVLCVSILAVPAVLSAQNTGSQSHDAPLTGFASPEEAKAIISEIMDAVGVKASFEVRAAKIPNAAAAVSRGRRFILYNPAFMAAINRATGSNRWAPISILAHEIGHHLVIPSRPLAAARPLNWKLMNFQDLCCGEWAQAWKTRSLPCG
jgi:hypothetical protein